MTELVHYAATDGVATITLDSPHNRNALSRRLVTGLFDGLDRAERDEDVKVVLLRSAGRVVSHSGKTPAPSFETQTASLRSIVAARR